jgi:hypothetical protein
MKATLYTLFAVAVVLALMWIAAADSLDKPKEPSRVTPIPLDRESYDALKPGMAFEQVVSAIGCEPTNTIVVRTPSGALARRHLWKDRYGQMISLRIVNGQLDDHRHAFFN